MKPESQRYLTPSSRNDRHRRKQVGRRRLALAVAVVVVAAAVFTWAIILPGAKKAPSSSSTTGRSTVSTSGASTTTSTGKSPAAGGLTYSAQLSGQNEIPVLVTPATGTLAITVAANNSSVHYVISVSKITDLTVARLHEVKAGTMGATILTLSSGPTRTGLFSGVLVQGNFTASEFVGPLQGKTISDLVALLKTDSIYLNVGTSAHILGEIRGQLK
jgi:hypothetical protein